MKMIRISQKGKRANRERRRRRESRTKLRQRQRKIRPVVHNFVCLVFVFLKFNLFSCSSWKEPDKKNKTDGKRKKHIFDDDAPASTSSMSKALAWRLNKTQHVEVTPLQLRRCMSSAHLGEKMKAKKDVVTWLQNTT